MPLLRPGSDIQREAVCLAIIELLWRVRTKCLQQIIELVFSEKIDLSPPVILSPWFARKELMD